LHRGFAVSAAHSFPKCSRQLALALYGDIDLRFGEDGAIAIMSLPIANPVQGGRIAVAV